GDRIVAPAGVEGGAKNYAATPNDHFTARPDGCVKLSRAGGISRGRCSPGVGGRIVAAASIQEGCIGPAPDDHFTTCPDRRMKRSRADVWRYRRLPGVICACRRSRRYYRQLIWVVRLDDWQSLRRARVGS